MKTTQVLYQDAATGAAWDITSLVSGPTWNTKRAGSPATFKFSAVPSIVNWTEGSVVCFLKGGVGYFYGYVFKIKRGMSGVVDITAYDQTRYLKNKDTYVFQGVRADQVVKEIAEDFELKLGALANTQYVIPSICEDGKTLFDIILKALDHTIVNTGQMYYLWDDYGALRLSSVLESKLDLFLGDGSLLTDYTYDRDIDSDTFNKIKLVQDNKDTGRRDVYIFKDSSTIARWGTLQDFESVDEKLNAAQIAARGSQLLELKNRPKTSFSLEGVSDLSVRAGRALYIQISEIGVGQYFVVEEASHDLDAETMSLKVKVA